jgi:hypothetical protein
MGRHTQPAEKRRHRWKLSPPRTEFNAQNHGDRAGGGGTEDMATFLTSTDLALGVAMEDSSLFEWRLARDRRFA